MDARKCCWVAHLMVSCALFSIALLMMMMIFPLNNTSTLFLSSYFHLFTSPPIEKTSMERIEDGLSRARAAIKSSYNRSYIPTDSIYRNPYAFHQSHVEMEKRLKVWVYREGEVPLVHGGPLNDIYGIEGQFIDEMERGESHFIAAHPDGAHLFFLPISVVNIRDFLYRPLVTYSRDQLQRLVSDYIRVVADKYPYWNRSNGADHFLLSCHDWGPDISSANPELYKNMIRALCNANKSESFKPERDVSVPEIKIIQNNLRTIDHHHQQLAKSLTNRTKLAFFAGGSHGYIRRSLLQKWKDKDDEIEVHEYLPNKADYFTKMAMSKFCLCPSGYEVASPRVVTAIQLGCVPVLISDNYSLPFSDVLDWSKFSVHIPSQNISEIKTILRQISQRQYLVLQSKVMQVQRHFLLNRPSQPYDMIHMVLHSLWLRRLNFRLPYN